MFSRYYMTRIKSQARSYVWWPDIDSAIEMEVKLCVQCQTNRSVPPVAPLHPWAWPTTAWSRVHIDHAGPFLSAYFLILIDSHSTWIEVEKVPSTATNPSIRALQRMFATHGLPDSIVSTMELPLLVRNFAVSVSKTGFDTYVPLRDIQPRTVSLSAQCKYSNPP
jgi:hypothetical protein